VPAFGGRQKNCEEYQLSQVDIQPAPDVAAERMPAAAAAALIRGRRTVHDFTAELPPRDLILRGIDAARWAPNHHATEPWHFYLLGSETAGEIAQLNATIVEKGRGPEAAKEKLERWLSVPGWLVVTCDNSEDVQRQREDYASVCCAIQNLQLYLWSEGVGVKWTTGAVTRDAQFYDLIWADPQAETVVGMLWYGYAGEVPQTARKAVDEILVTLP
jgi:nitroreductase